jgi:DNA processing protein
MDGIDLQLALGRSYELNAARLESLVAAIGAEVPPECRLRELFQRSTLVRERLASLGAVCLLEDRRWAESAAVQLVDLWSPHYPPQLAALPDRPPLLYVQGSVSLLSQPQLAMAGSRQASVGGRRTAHRFAAHVARAGIAITSGLAEGIDAASHEGALAAGGSSIAVLGSGLDRIYPRMHEDLAQRLLVQGALISEFPPRTPPRRHHFPQRNRIISGLSNGLLVVEAALSSGSLSTARWAREQRRECFAVPGSIYNPLAKGCHQLIRDGAHLVEEPGEILQLLQFDEPKQLLIDLAPPASGERFPAGPLDNQYKILLDALGFEPARFDELVERTGLPSQSVASILLTLELRGVIGSIAGGHYLRISSGDHATQRF